MCEPGLMPSSLSTVDREKMARYGKHKLAAEGLGKRWWFYAHEACKSARFAH